MRNIFLGLTFAAALANVAVFVKMAVVLDRLGYKTSIVLARIHFFEYVAAYKGLTKKETGKTGPLFGTWILTIILTLGFAIVAVLLPRG